MRQYVDGINDPVFALVNVAAGDSIDCNINNFPEATFTSAIETVTFPPDTKPTVEDVKKIMDQEQKKNAGFKIAAGLVVGGLVGNMSGKNDPGASGLVGTGKGKMQGTAVGALSGAALMAGSSYAGKVGGDVIMSAGINAAAGGAIGNMVASGDSVLQIEDCTIGSSKTECLWGVLQKSSDLSGKTGFYNIDDGKTMACEVKDGKFEKCKEERLIGMTFDGYASVDAGIADQKFRNAKPDDRYNHDPKEESANPSPTGVWIKATRAGTPGQRVTAMIPNFHNKTFGVKTSDWVKWRADEFKSANAQIYSRDNKGEPSKEPLDSKEWKLQDFYPLTVSASDGGIIDINNKARMKGTLIGAGAGAGLGAFTAYQGAQDEIDARYVSAVQEYQDSLTNFYCATGTRFLSQYNDVVIIPNMSE
jgi:hypothetical protein